MKLTASEILGKLLDGSLDRYSEWVRVEPKKYRLKLDLPIDLGNGRCYLNYYPTVESFDIHTRIQVDGVVTKFTDKDIEKLDIPIAYFTKEEV